MTITIKLRRTTKSELEVELEVQQFTTRLNELISIVLLRKNLDGSVTSDEQLLTAAQSIRKMLSCDDDSAAVVAFDDVVKANLVPSLVDWLSREENVTLQLEAAWALTNLATGTSMHTRHLVDAGAIKPLIKLLSSQDSNLREQAVWALANIAGIQIKSIDYKK
jgi:hypothetical protein